MAASESGAVSAEEEEAAALAISLGSKALTQRQVLNVKNQKFCQIARIRRAKSMRYLR
jgi:hypothetical protein